jgi:hypothetical protein
MLVQAAGLPRFLELLHAFAPEADRPGFRVVLGQPCELVVPAGRDLLLTLANPDRAPVLLQGAGRKLQVPAGDERCFALGRLTPGRHAFSDAARAETAFHLLAAE